MFIYKKVFFHSLLRHIFFNFVVVLLVLIVFQNNFSALKLEGFETLTVLIDSYKYWTSKLIWVQYLSDNVNNENVVSLYRNRSDTILSFLARLFPFKAFFDTSISLWLILTISRRIKIRKPLKTLW